MVSEGIKWKTLSVQEYR